MKRVYVESFTTRAESEKLRQSVISELSKDHSISVVATESAADLILGGGGEIWVKSYKSLNPRSARSPSNGTPVYAGYLSVELRSKNGETIGLTWLLRGRNRMMCSKTFRCGSRSRWRKN